MPAAPSLLIVPYRSKTGKLYSQIPTSGAGDFTVTRNTTATRFNSAGLLESVASGIPRLDYATSGGTVGCPALLVEPAGTNLALRSEAIQTSPWSGLIAGTGVAPTITANNAVAPDGATTATKILLDRGAGTTVSDASIWNQSITVTAVAHTFSVWLKSATGGNQIVQLRVNSAPSTTITITTDWQRFTVVNTPTAGSRQYGFDLRGNTAGAGQTAEFYAWGAQLETGSVATSYIPTTTGSVTRNADVISVSGAVSGSIGQTEGTFYFDFQASPSGASSNWLNISDGTTNNWLFIGKADNKCRAYIRASNSVILSDTSFTLTGSSIKAALAYKSGDYAFYINGNVIASGTTAFTFSAGLTRIHSGGEMPQAVNEISRYRAVALYTTRLTNAELALITQP